MFRPRGHFSQLAADHVPFDRLVGHDRYETVALAALTADAPVGVVGPRGAGKSSLIAHVCSSLPDTHIALRVPVTGADDPTSVSVVAAVALSQALDDLDLESYQREALNRARSDQDTRQKTPGGLRGGTLGGGPVPAQVHAELGSLREELSTNRLAAERLAGLDRLITILVARGLQPIFVLEDTEAAIGGADQPEVAAAFLAGPAQAFVTELETPCLIAIQTAFTTGGTFAQLAAQMRLIEIPQLDDTNAAKRWRRSSLTDLSSTTPATTPARYSPTRRSSSSSASTTRLSETCASPSRRCRPPPSTPLTCARTGSRPATSAPR